MKIRKLFILIAMIWTGLSYAGTYSGGNGSSDIPYQIANLNDLLELSTTPADWATGKYFIQTANIDAVATSGWNSGAGFSPIGNSGNYFQGNYDGQNFIVARLYINRGAETVSHGLFGEAGGATIQNLGLLNVNVTGCYAGSLVGYARNETTIENCWATGVVGGHSYTGGLIGTMDGTISNSFFSGNVTASDSRVGGLAGYVGYNDPGTISYCYSEGEVSSTGSYVGGLIGSVGDYGTTTSNSYSRAQTTGGDYCGGFIGHTYDSEITNSYSTGIVTCSGANKGGFIGYDDNSYYSTFTSCYWDTETSQQSTSQGGTGKTTNQMKTQDTFTGWDFATPVWVLNGTSNDGYPYLNDTELFSYFEGSGTSGDPYLISNLNDLWRLSVLPDLWNTHFKQTANIDATATSTWNSNGIGGFYGFSPVGRDYNTRFTGSYDGQSYTISNLFINRPTEDYTAFFGYAGDATLADINLATVDITGKRYVGAICGKSNNCTINNCDASGSILCNSYYGGLIGYSDEGTIINSSFSGTIAGGTYIGGLIGSLENTDITGCYATGTITSSWYAGGLIGFIQSDEDPQISTSYSDVNLSNGADGYAGGFIGALDGSYPTINNCYSLGSITGTGDFLGGFIGYAYGYEAYINNCYSMTNVDGADYAGGFLGYAYYLYMTNCYFAGLVSGTEGYTGGLIGYDDGDAEFTNSFWDTETSGQTSSGTSTGTGKTTIEMKTQTTFTNWDFITPIWEIKSGATTSYPYLHDLPQIPAPGEFFIWTGTTNTDWATTTNWNTGAVPATGAHVIIPNEANDPVIFSGIGASCNNLTVEAGASLTINSGGSLITNGTITNNGTINIKRNITSGVWHLVSNPLTSATANIFVGNYLQNWDETSGTWSDIVETSTSLTPVKGYSLWTIDGTPTDYTFTGTPNTGNQSLAITHTEVAGTGFDGANLLGNPYPSSIDWSGLDDTYGAVNYWNGTAYVSWNNGSGSGSQYIPPMQGFFIVTGTAGTFSVGNANRTHTGATNYYKSLTDLSAGLVLFADNGSYRDDLWLLQRENRHTGFDLESDAYKFMSSTPGISQLWSVCPDGNLSIDARPYQQTIQLGFANDEPGLYTIGISEIADITSTLLEDTKTNLFHDLTKGTYEFAWDVNDDENRFKLHLNVVGLEETPGNESNILIYAANGNIFIKGAEKCEVRVSDLMGRTVLQQQINGADIISIPANLKTGIYLVMVQQGKDVKTEKIFIR